MRGPLPYPLGCRRCVESRELVPFAAPDTTRYGYGDENASYARV